MGTREFLWNVYRFWTGSSQQTNDDEPQQEPTSELPSGNSLQLPDGTSTTLSAVLEQIDSADYTSVVDLYRLDWSSDEDTTTSVIDAAALRDPPRREEWPMRDDVGLFAPVVLPTTGHGAAGLAPHRGQNPRPKLVPKRQHRPVPREEAEPRRYTRFVERTAGSIARRPSIDIIRNVEDENRPMVLPVEADVSNDTDEQEYMSFNSSISFSTKSCVGTGVKVASSSIRTAATSRESDPATGQGNATSTTSANDAPSQPSVTGPLFGTQRWDCQQAHVLDPVNRQEDDRRPLGFGTQVTAGGNMSQVMMRAAGFLQATPPRCNIILRRADGSTPFRPLENLSTMPQAEQVDGSFSGPPPSIPQQEGGSHFSPSGINQEALVGSSRHRGGFSSDFNVAGATRGLLGLDAADTNTSTAFDEATLMPTFGTPAFPFGQRADWGEGILPANFGESRRKLPFQQAPGFDFAPPPVTAKPFYFGRSLEVEPPADARPPSPMDVDSPNQSYNQAPPGTSSCQSEKLPCTQAPNLEPFATSWQFGDQGCDAPFMGTSLPAPSAPPPPSTRSPQDQPAATGIFSSLFSLGLRRTGKKNKPIVRTPASRPGSWFISSFSTAAVGKPEVSPTDVSPPRVQYDANRAAQPLPIPAADCDDTIRVQPGIFGHSYSRTGNASAAAAPPVMRPSYASSSDVAWRPSEIAANSSAIPSFGMTPFANWPTATPNTGFRSSIPQPPIHSSISSLHSSWTAMHQVEPPAGPSYNYPPAAEAQPNFIPAQTIPSMPDPSRAMHSFQRMQEAFDHKASLRTAVPANEMSAEPQEPVRIEPPSQSEGLIQNALDALPIATVNREPEGLDDMARAVTVDVPSTEHQGTVEIPPSSLSEKRNAPDAPSLTRIIEETLEKSPTERIETNSGDRQTAATSVATTTPPVRSSRLRLPPLFSKPKPEPIVRPDNKRKMPSIEAEELFTETSVCDFDPTAPSAKRIRMVDLVKGAPRKYHRREDTGFLSILIPSAVKVANQDKPTGSSLFKPAVQARLERQRDVERELKDLEQSTIANISKILGSAEFAKGIVSRRAIPEWLDKKSKEFKEVVQQLIQYSRFMEDTILGTRTESTGSDSGPSSQEITSQNNDRGKRDVQHFPRTDLLIGEKPPSASETTLVEPFERTTTAGTDGERSRAGADESSILLFPCSQTSVDDSEAQEGTQVNTGAIEQPQQLETGPNGVQSPSKAAVESSIEDANCLSQDGASMATQHQHASSPLLGTSHRLISFDSTLADSIVELMPSPLKPSRPGTTRTDQLPKVHQEEKNSELAGFSSYEGEGDSSDDIKTYSVQDVDGTMDDDEEGSSAIELIELDSEVDLLDGHCSSDTAAALPTFTEDAAFCPENQIISPQLVSFQSENEVCVAKLQEINGFDIAQQHEEQDPGRPVPPTRRQSNPNKRQRDDSSGSDPDDNGFNNETVRNGNMYYEERHPPKRRKLRHEGYLASSNLEVQNSSSVDPSVSPGVHVLPDNQVIEDLSPARSFLEADPLDNSDDWQLPLGLPSPPVEETSHDASNLGSASSLGQLTLPVEMRSSSFLFEETEEQSIGEADEDDRQTPNEVVGPGSLETSDDEQLPFIGLPSPPAVDETSGKGSHEPTSSVTQLTSPTEMSSSSCLFERTDELDDDEENEDDSQIMNESSPEESLGPADSSDAGQLPLGLPSPPVEETSSEAQLELASSVVQLTLPAEMGSSSYLILDQADQRNNNEEAGDDTRQTKLQQQPEPHRRTIRIPRKNPRKHLSLPSRLWDTTYLEISLEGSVLEEDDNEAVIQPNIVLPTPNGASGNSDVAQDLVQQPVGPQQDTSSQEPDENISSKESSRDIPKALVDPTEALIAQMVATARLRALQPIASRRETSALVQNSSSQGEMKRSIKTGLTVSHQENQQQDPGQPGSDKEECPTGTKKNMAENSIIPAASRKVSFDLPDEVPGGRSYEISQLREPSIKDESENYVEADDQHPFISSTTEEETFGSMSISFGTTTNLADSFQPNDATNSSGFSVIPSGDQSPPGNLDQNLTGLDSSHYEGAEAAEVEEDSLSASSNTSVLLSSFSDGPEPPIRSRNTPVISPKLQFSEEQTDDPAERTGAGQVSPSKLDSRPETSLLRRCQPSSSRENAIKEQSTTGCSRATKRNIPSDAMAEEDEEKAGPEKRSRPQADRCQPGSTSHPAPSNCAGRSTNKQSKSGSRGPSSVKSQAKRRGTAGSKSSVPANIEIDEVNIIFKKPAFAYSQEHRKRVPLGTGAMTLAKPKPLDGIPDDFTVVVFQGDKNATYLVQKGQRATVVSKNGQPTKYVLYFHAIKPSSDSSASRKVGKKALLVRTSSKREAQILCRHLRKAIKDAQLALPGF